MFDFIDPFIWQLLIVPCLTIGIGVMFALRYSKTFLAPLLTLLSNATIELTMGFLYDPYLLSLTSWNVIFPIFSFVIAYTWVKKQKIE